MRSKIGSCSSLFFGSLYWTVVTGTTIGLGDEAPTNEYVRLFCVFFLPFCVAVLGESLSRIAGLYLRRKQARAQKAFFDRSLTLADIEIMDTDKDGSVSKAEFLCYMLVALQRVEQDDLTELLDLFEKLDKVRCHHHAELLDGNASVKGLTHFVPAHLCDRIRQGFCTRMIWKLSDSLLMLLVSLLEWTEGFRGRHSTEVSLATGKNLIPPQESQVD